jgi:hypothetical protein
MNGRKSLLGLCMLCALMVSAVAAQSAMAVSGTTGFTCVNDEVNGTLSGPHCKDSGGTGKYKHVEIEQDKTTEIKISNATTEGGTSNQLFAETIAGVPLELKATGLNGTGTQTNTLDIATGEHYIHGTALLEYTGVTVVKPEGKGCKVFTDDPVTKAKGVEGKIDAHLDFTTLGQGHSIKFTPAAGTNGAPFAGFYVECSPVKVPAIEGTFAVEGSVTCVPNRGTIKCNHNEVTTANTLKGKGVKAGYEGEVTVTGRVKESGAEYTPLSVTTVTTP